MTYVCLKHCRYFLKNQKNNVPLKGQKISVFQVDGNMQYSYSNLFLFLKNKNEWC